MRSERACFVSPCAILPKEEIKQMKEERAAAVKPVLGSATCSGLPSLRTDGRPPYRIRQPRHAALRGAELTATELSIKGALILARRGSIRRAGYHAI
jgi:hypothetical protein